VRSATKKRNNRIIESDDEGDQVVHAHSALDNSESHGGRDGSVQRKGRRKPKSHLLNDSGSEEPRPRRRKLTKSTRLHDALLSGDDVEDISDEVDKDRESFT
jgi:hypothetical protein